MTEQELEQQTREAFAVWRSGSNADFDYTNDGDYWRPMKSDPNWLKGHHYRIRPGTPEPPFVLTREWFSLHVTWIKAKRGVVARLVIEVCDEHVRTTQSIAFTALQRDEWQAMRVGVDSEWIDLSTGKAVEK